MEALAINPDVHAALALELDRIHAPRCRLNAWQWAERSLSLTPEESRDHSGPYDTALMPYARRLLEFLTNPGEHEFIPRKSSQLGFTLSYLVGICFRAATRPTHVLYAMDSAKESTRISTRLIRLLKTNPSMADTYVGDGADDLQNLLLRLRGMDVWLIGSGAAGGFANKSAGLVVLDELDLHLASPKGRPDTIDLARERLKKVQDGKLIAGGKPEEWHAATNQNYLTGTREEIYLPCPRCDHPQPIRWEAMRFAQHKDLAGGWDLPGVIADTYCECEVCHGRMHDHEKPAMLRRATCVATNKGQDKYKPFPGRVSLWVNDLISTDPQNSWGNIAARWIDSQDSVSKLRVFINGVLARPEEEKKVEIAPGDIKRLAGQYDHGCMPFDPPLNDDGESAIILGVDKQAAYYRWVKVGLRPSGEAFVIDYGRCLSEEALHIVAGDPVWIGFRAPDPDQIDALRAEAHAMGIDFLDHLRSRRPDLPFRICNLGVIDEGYDTFGIRKFCHASMFLPCRFFAAKGVDHVNPRELVEIITDRFKTTPDDTTGPVGALVAVYHFNDDAIKRDLYLGRIRDFDQIKSGKSSVPRLWTPADPEEDFCAELSAEHRVQAKKRKRLVMEWGKPTGPNHAGDALKLALMLWVCVKFGYATPGGANPPRTMDEDGRLSPAPENG